VNNDVGKWNDNNCCITADGFLKFVHELKIRKCNIFSVDDLNQEMVKAKQGVVITFDDVFEDAYLYAFPILIKYNIPFCIFVSENIVDKEGYITSSELAMLAKEPLCTIGYHTKNHLLMRYLTPKEIEYESDCSSLIQKINKDIKYFAFPYGSVYACSKRNIDIVKKKNYNFSFSTIAVPCTMSSIKKHKAFLPRINVNEVNYKTLLERYHI
jgi:peptidoglycan/xylan/chitin deacetylase (PgdA/CDA1 family)